MATEEYCRLKAKAMEAGLTKSACFRRCVISSIIYQRLTPEILDFIRKLCGMVNNMNQIAHIMRIHSLPRNSP